MTKVDEIAYEVRPLAEAERQYALSAWREAHHSQPSVCAVPWSIYKRTYGAQFELILRDPRTLALGAYAPDGPYGEGGAVASGECLGFLVATPGARVDVLHWVQVRFRDRANRELRRRGIMTALLRAADLGDRWIYTLKARRIRGKRVTLDKVLASALVGMGLGTATYVPIQDWLR